ncbi:ubiquitin-conjugating enzyme E2-binding protein [Lasiosphaeria hispida]|uniref:Ubiquitin-conjugating enzyme E2-binding protein n=1 Tax=Lasiosphaeria hispida TaxID=260671 RepID=A0AAJ0HUD2_9PEZI|nr:ubiquitin-conjugating enzyme E2-binding protein [Lasiosphaeria hispida]
MASQSLIYAELLPNIRQISLAVSLSSPSDASTRVTVTADGISITLAHHSDTHQLRLPAKVSVGAAALPIQKQGVTTLSWRLPLDPKCSLAASATQSQATPWSATDLKPGSEVSCRECNTVIVSSGAIPVWKDLPSENWAEMMELWHCHKPEVAGHDSHHHDDAGKADEKGLAARGYGASSTISSQGGVGFVDLTTLLFAETDCHGLTFSLSGYEQGSANRQDLAEAESRNLNVCCNSCHAQLGFFNFRTAAVTLLKWQVSSRSTSTSFPGIPECLAATLISTISRSGSSKSLITPIPESTAAMATASARTSTNQAIHIWVLNSGIVYSSSGTAQCTPAVKLLYRLISQDEADRMLGGVTCEAQEVNLPRMAISEAIRCLDDSNLLLPSTERVFKEWRVGLLRR